MSNTYINVKYKPDEKSSNNSESLRQVEYVWLDGDKNFRSKSRVISEYESLHLKNIPEWSYDGSSTGQASTEESEIIIRPVCVCKCPFRKHGALIVLCATYDPQGAPTETNTYENAMRIFNQKRHLVPSYGLEQEFFIVRNGEKITTAPTSKHYCGVGNGIFHMERELMEEFWSKALYAGLSVCGINAEVAKHQWEFQVGICVGEAAANNLLLARYVLGRVAEKYNCIIDYTPKPYYCIEWGCNGSGCHTNFSTKHTMQRKGIIIINEYIEKLGTYHHKSMSLYGEGNEKRMTGANETSSFKRFTHSIGGRNVSVRIPIQVAKSSKGYFEDRRPASNCDPYIVTSSILQFCTS
jgi:glutamine synthetase